MEVKRMLFKRILVLLVCSGVAAILAACTGQQAIQYDGKQQQVDQVEEIIADKLEVENPDLDVTVTITTTNDDE
jgi:ABC-type glycerol-3-phosphate transport system substrate-binding protein